MRRATLVLCALCACERPFEGVARADVDWTLASEKPACVRVRAFDGDDATREEVRELPVRGLAGRFTLALGQPRGWSRLMGVVASLHLDDCAAALNVADRATVTFELNRLKTVPLILVERVIVDAGGGPDGGAPDGGSTDGGDVDGGDLDGGDPDGGADAGPISCDGGVYGVLAQSSNWRDLVIRGADVFLAGQGGALGSVSRGGVLTSWSGGTCGLGDVNGVARRPSDGKLFAISTTDGLVRVDARQSCASVLPLPDGGLPRALTAFEQGAELVLFVATSGSGSRPVLTRAVVGASVSFVDVVIGRDGDELRDVAGTSELNLFAAGWESSGTRGIIYRYDSGGGAWHVSKSFSGSSALYALDVIGPTTAFAAGDVFAQWTGTDWTQLPNPPFRVRGLRALSTSEVWAVGDALGGQLGVARWDGAQWSVVSTFSSTAGLARLRGRTACELWAAGAGAVVTTTP